MRLIKLDILKVFAIISMIFFHLNYMLINIFWNNAFNFSDNFWLILWKIWWFLFIFLSGFSFYLADKKYSTVIYKKYLSVILKLFIVSILITLFTYIFFKTQVIWFWILHFFSLSFLLMLLFKNFWYYNLLFILLFFISFFYFPIIQENKYLFPLWLIYTWFFSSDYYPIIPFFWYMLLWFVFWKFVDEKNLLYLLSWKENKYVSYLAKNSLNIYILHVPLIYIILYLLLNYF